MKRRGRSPGRRERGLGIVELMIALALGLLAVLLASVLLVSANAGYGSQVEAARVDDGGRFALEVIARAVRQAGYVSLEGDDGADLDPTASASVEGLDAHTLSKADHGIDHPRPSVANGSDVLAVRFAGSGEAPNGDGSIINCAGFGVPDAGNGDGRGWSIFYVGRGADGETELRCKYRGHAGWGADAIARGVDSFQVLYGLDTDDPPDGMANRYVTATDLNGLDDALALSGADSDARERDRRRKTHWKRVAGIKLALLLHGAGNTRPGTAAAVFDLFGKAYSDAAGGADVGARIAEDRLAPALKGRERRLFTATIVLRNGAQ